MNFPKPPCWKGLDWSRCNREGERSASISQRNALGLPVSAAGFPPIQIIAAWRSGRARLFKKILPLPTADTIALCCMKCVDYTFHTTALSITFAGF